MTSQLEGFDGYTRQRCHPGNNHSKTSFEPEGKPLDIDTKNGEEVALEMPPTLDEFSFVRNQIRSPICLAVYDVKRVPILYRCLFGKCVTAQTIHS